MVTNSSFQGSAAQTAITPSLDALIPVEHTQVKGFHLNTQRNNIFVLFRGRLNIIFIIPKLIIQITAKSS